ncbi:MAG: DUF4386 family protein [Chloroflexi bacterium]|nr:DUF4386 family protein [Chloroflexota bacterium]
MGGVAALYLATAYVIGIVMFLFVLDYMSVDGPDEKVGFLVDNKELIYITNLVLYVVFGGFLIVLALALYERLKTGAPALMQMATIVGIIWAAAVIASGMIANTGIAPVVDLYDDDPAQAATAWLGIDAVANGLGGGGGEFLGGLWTLLVSWAALRTNMFSKALNYLGLTVGVVGLVSTIPGLADLGGLFGISQIVWFVWVGSILLRSSSQATAVNPA